ncbi:MAG TPA: FixH family protein [Nannocystaceae bacterium]|nr:FixH family protein [Nannocystaceae bacterium]
MRPPLAAPLRIASLLLASLPLGLAGCDEDAMAEADDDAGDEDAGADEDATARDCTTEMRADHYALGLRKVGSAFTVQFVDALPAPPARGDNTWRVMVTDDGGAGLSDLALGATPFMPDHGHGTTVATTVTPGAVPGEYVLDPVNLFMPGLWEVTLEMTTPDATTDEVVFRFCVDP